MRVLTILAHALCRLLFCLHFGGPAQSRDAQLTLAQT